MSDGNGSISVRKTVRDSYVPRHRPLLSAAVAFAVGIAVANYLSLELWCPLVVSGWCAACLDIGWSGLEGLQEILVYGRGTGAPIAIYDGPGHIVAEIARPDDGGGYCTRADVWGDSREEVIVVGRNGVRIHANRRALPLATLYNNTLYHGM